MVLLLLSSSLTVIFLCLLTGCFVFEVRVTKVKGHADDGMVLDGRVRELDKFGDDAADFCRRRVGHAVIDARRNLSGECGRWYPVILDLHRFFIAISRAVVHHDGNDGAAPDPIFWSAGALPQRRRLVHAVRDLAMLPGPPRYFGLVVGFMVLLLLLSMLKVDFGGGSS